MNGAATWRMIAAIACALPGAAPAQTGGERDYVPSRPGLGTPAGTIAPGRVSLEVGIAEWERDRQSGMRTDTVDLGDTTIRVGIGDATELLVSWTPFEHVRVSDRATGRIERERGVGDVAVGFKQNLRNPDGDGFSIAISPFVSLPVGGGSTGAGDWGAGLVVPASYDLNDAVSLQLTSEIDAATDDDGNGRHLAYSVIAGIGVQLTDTLGATGELAVARDRDPDGRSTQAVGSVSLAWMATDDLQLDVGGTVGLNRRTPDHMLYAGISRRF